MALRSGVSKAIALAVGLLFALAVPNSVRVVPLLSSLLPPTGALPCLIALLFSRKGRPISSACQRLISPTLIH